MAIAQYLAMTAAEFREDPAFPSPIAWMGCHFSPYGRGLSNRPQVLPAGSILMVDDITPIHTHDPELIARQIRDCLERFSLSGVLLDFQREGYPRAADLAAFLVQALPCPVCVSALYAGQLRCPVLLPPIPPSQPLEEALAPWTGRDIWLEVTREGESIILTDKGAATEPLHRFPEAGFPDEALCCHYQVDISEEAASFSLWRTAEDQEALLQKAQAFGVRCSFELYQQWKGA